MLRRKRQRANSDSELTLLDSYNRQRRSLAFHYHSFNFSQSVTDDDIHIGILPDSPIDPHVFYNDYTMDPSEMFVSPANSPPESIFPCSPPPVENMDTDDTDPVREVSDVVSESLVPKTMISDALLPEPLVPLEPMSPLDSPQIINPVPMAPVPTDSVSMDPIVMNRVVLDPVPLDPVVIEPVPLQVKETPPVIIPQLIVFNIAPPPASNASRVNSQAYQGHPQQKRQDGGKGCKKNSYLLPKPSGSPPVDKEGFNEVNQQWINEKPGKGEDEEVRTWKSGAWSVNEENLLRKNIDAYCSTKDISDVRELVYDTSKDRRKDFYRSISSGINRPLFSVYRKVLRMYNRKNNHAGKFTTEEVEKLIKLNQLCPNDWKTIGFMLERSSSSVKDRARLLKPEKKCGQWSKLELESLSSAIHSMTATKVGDRLTGKINWKLVAENVPMRTAKQCRKKWLTHLQWKEAGGKDWVKYDEIILINKIVDLNMEDESSIKWDALSEGWDSVRSPSWLREKWWHIKRAAYKENPNREFQFRELLDWLQKVYIPNVVERFGYADSQGESLALKQKEGTGGGEVGGSIS